MTFAVPFTIPHEVEATFDDQAKPDKIDFAIIIQAMVGHAWMGGAQVHAPLGPDLVLGVDAGAIALGDQPIPTPAANVTLVSDPSAARFALVFADQLPIVSYSRAGTTITMKLGVDPVDQGWTVGETISVYSDTTAASATGVLLLSVTSNGDGTGVITYTHGTGTVTTTPSVGSVSHVGVLHGDPQLGTNKPPFPSLPAYGAVVLAAVYLRAGETTIDDSFIIDKRIPRRGAVKTAYNPMEWPYLCKNDNVTYDGDQFYQCCLDAFARGLGVEMPGGAGFKMVNGTTPKQLIFDFGTKTEPGDFLIRGGGQFGRTKLDYTGAIFPLNLDPTDPSDGDPGGRVPTGAISGININNSSGSLRLEAFDLIGPNPSRDNTAATPGDFLALNLRPRGFGVGMGGGGRTRCTDLNVTGFFAGFYDRLDNNHNFITFCTSTENWYGEYWATSASRIGYNSANGDHTRIGNFMSSNACASFASDPAGLIFNSAFYSNHLGGTRFGYYQEFGQAGNIIMPSNAHYSRDNTTGVVSIDTKWSSSPTWPASNAGPPTAGYNWPGTILATTVDTGSDGQVLTSGSQIIFAVSTASFPTSGKFTVDTDQGPQVISYTNKTGGGTPSFTGCTGFGLVGKVLTLGGNIAAVDLLTSQPPAQLYPGEPYPTVWGLHVGDVMDLSVLAGRAGVTFGDKGNVGVIADITGDVIKLVMGDYLTSTTGTDQVGAGHSIASTAIPAIDPDTDVGEWMHVYNNDDWLRGLGMFDSTFEGCGEGFVFSAGGFGGFKKCYGFWQCHGNEVQGRNTGILQSLPKLAISAASRKWDHQGDPALGGTETAPQNGDVYHTVLTVPSGHGVRVGDVIFSYLTGKTIADCVGNVDTNGNVTLTSGSLPGAGTDWPLLNSAVDEASHAHIPANSTIRTVTNSTHFALGDKDGKAITTSVATGITLSFYDDFPGGGAGGLRKGFVRSRATGKYSVVDTSSTTVTYEQFFDSVGRESLYTGTVAHPYAVTNSLPAGARPQALCTTQAFRVGEMDGCNDLDLDFQHESQSGTGYSEIQILCKNMWDCDINVSDGIMLWVRLQAHTVSDVSATFPVSSVFTVGRLEARVMRAAEALVPGHVVGFSDHDDAQRYVSGGYLAGVVLYDASHGPGIFGSGDFVVVATRGPTKTSKWDYGGLLTSDATITQNTTLGADPVTPGYARRASIGDPLIGKGSAATTGTGSPYRAPATVEVINVPPASATIEVFLLDTLTALVVGDGVGNFIFSVPALLNGKSLLTANAFVTTPSTGTGLPTFQVNNTTSNGGGSFDMLSTPITIDVGELDSSSAATPSAVNNGRRHVVTGDQLRFDVDGVGGGGGGTVPLGLGFRLTFG